MIGTRPLGLLAIVTALMLLRAVPAYSDAIGALAIDPVTPTTLYAGTPGGGVFKSTDGGANWSATGLTNAYVADLVIDPQTPTILYARTLDGKVYKSTDGGASWNAKGPTGLSAGPTGSGVSLAIDPRTTPSTLYAGTYDAVLKSTDGGATWSATSGLSGLVSSIVIDPVDPSILYAGTDGPPLSCMSYRECPRAGVYRSTDGSAWSPVLLYFESGNGWNFAWGCWPCGGVLALAIDPLIPTTLFGGTDDLAEWDFFGEIVYSAPGDLIKTTDGGISWPVLYGAPGRIHTFVIEPRNHPLDPITFYAVAGSGGLFKSTDGGAHWSAIGLNVPGAFAALAMDPVTPTTLYAGTSAGVFKSIDGGTTWSATGVMEPGAALSSVSLAPTSVSGGGSSVGTVVLNASAPAGGVVVTLSSSNTVVATVPGGVTVPAGSTTATFTVATSPVTTSTTVTISATGGGTTRFAELAVTPAATLISVSLQPNSVPAGSPATGIATLSAPAPAGGGAVVTLSSSNTAVAAVPASVTVPAGATTIGFVVTTNAVTSVTVVTISATSGGVTRSAALTVAPATALVSISLSPTNVRGGTSSTGTIMLSAAAPLGGVTMTVSSSHPSIAAVPSSITVPPGATSGQFTVSTSRPKSPTVVTISAKLGDVEKSATLTVKR